VAAKKAALRLKDLYSVITDANAPLELIEQVRALGTEVVVV
jgi:hypothetical protein